MADTPEFTALVRDIAASLAGRDVRRPDELPPLTGEQIAIAIRNNEYLTGDAVAGNGEFIAEAVRKTDRPDQRELAQLGAYWLRLLEMQAKKDLLPSVRHATEDAFNAIDDDAAFEAGVSGHASTRSYVRSLRDTGESFEMAVRIEPKEP